MKSKYLVTKVTKCACCSGGGYVDNPAFDDSDDCKEPEEILCGECDGFGETREEVDLFTEFPSLM